MRTNSAVANWKVARLVNGMLLVALVCLTSGLASLEVNAKTNGNERYQVLGTIESIDSSANTITVKLADGTDKIMQLGKDLTINGRQESRSRAESALTAQERAVVYYTNKGGEDTAVNVESLNHAMPRTVAGTLISADKDKVVLKTAKGKEETFRVRNDAVVETADGVMIFSQYEPLAGAQITLHYDDPMGIAEVSRIKH